MRIRFIGIRESQRQYLNVLYISGVFGGCGVSYALCLISKMRQGSSDIPSPKLQKTNLARPFHIQIIKMFKRGIQLWRPYRLCHNFDFSSTFFDHFDVNMITISLRKIRLQQSCSFTGREAFCLHRLSQNLDFLFGLGTSWEESSLYVDLRDRTRDLSKCKLEECIVFWHGIGLNLVTMAVFVRSEFKSSSLCNSS